MGIDKKVNEHPVIAVITVCVTVITAAVGVMKWIYDEKTNLTISKYESEIALLRKECEEKTKLKLEVNQSDKISRVDVKEIIKPIQQVETNYGDIFKKNYFYPLGFDKVKIGTRTSILQTEYPSGKLDSMSYNVELSTGPFESIYFFYDDSSASDPKIESIVFYFRDDKSCDYVRSKALSAFDDKYIVSSVMGKVIKWKAKGVLASIEGSYYNIETSE